ncbi:MAG: tetratricopeptide repeat protein [Myxococcota bacterium]|nr:tetratricopeptide repeat protein [Myxococcota bacterium]
MALLRVGLLLLAIFPPLSGSAEDPALAPLRARAEGGEMAAQRDLGVRYFRGDGVERDALTAALWLGRAAEQGDSDAQNKLGFLYAQGLGVARDEALAARWYRRSAEQGDAKGQFNLGLAYESGSGVEQSGEEATAWWRRAAVQGHREAQIKLAVAYARGEGVRRDPARAFFFAEIVAERLSNDVSEAQRQQILTLRDSLATALSPEAQAEVRAAARAWEPES